MHFAWGSVPLIFGLWCSAGTFDYKKRGGEMIGIKWIFVSAFLIFEFISSAAFAQTSQDNRAAAMNALANFRTSMVNVPGKPQPSAVIAPSTDAIRSREIMAPTSIQPEPTKKPAVAAAKPAPVAAPVIVQAPVPVVAPSPAQDDTDVTNAALEQYEKAYQIILNSCVQNIQSQKSAISTAKKREQDVTIIGASFAGAASLSTYHPVSAGLAVIAAILTGGNSTVAGIGQANVEEQTANYNAYQSNVDQAKKAYSAIYVSATTKDPNNPFSKAALAQIYQGLNDLLATCMGVGQEDASQSSQNQVTPVPAAK